MMMMMSDDDDDDDDDGDCVSELISNGTIALLSPEQLSANVQHADNTFREDR